jgi:hypothetical protein
VKRLEVIANQSVREELIDELEVALPQIEYTLFPIAHGKGRRKRKEGTRTWPETNFYLLVYLDEASAAAAAATVSEIRRRFPDEGIFAAVSEAEPVAGYGAAAQ